MPTYDMGIVQFRDLILKNPGVKATLQKTLLSTIHRERMGELVDRTVLLLFICCCMSAFKTLFTNVG